MRSLTRDVVRQMTHTRKTARQDDTPLHRETADRPTEDRRNGPVAEMVR
jgi:hypothetical protein